MAGLLKPLEAVAALALWTGVGLAAQTPAAAPTPPPASPAAEITPAARAEAVLSAGDKLHFFIEEDPVKGAGPTELLVSPVEEISFPVSRNSDVLIPISVRGKSLAQVKEELKRKLDADYYYNATVFLKISDQVVRRGQVFFSGEVQTKILPLAGGEKLTLFEAIMKVGYTQFANLKKVQLFRQAGDKPKTGAQVFDVDAMMRGDRSKDVLLQDGDHVNVPEKKFVGF